MLFRLKIKENEYFWGGAVSDGADMPINKNSLYSRDFRNDAHNQFMPLFLSSLGRYVWSEGTFKVWIEDGELCFEGDSDFVLYEGGTSLRDAYLHAMENHFPFDQTRVQSKTLPRDFFKSAQFNSWIEFAYDPTQKGILEYAHAIIDNGFEPGMGDVLSLIEKAEEAYDKKQAEALEKKMRENSFTLADYLDQMAQLKKMGSLESVMAMVPGMSGKDVKIDEDMLVRTEAIILSMTKKERDNPDIINSSRKKRIAKGSGTSVEEINRLLKQFEQMKKLMKQMSSGKFKGFGGIGRKGMKMPF